MAKNQEDKRRRRTMSVVRALLAVREILAMVNQRQKRLMQLDVYGGEIGGLRRSCVMCGQNIIKRRMLNRMLMASLTRQRETAIGK